MNGQYVVDHIDNNRCNAKIDNLEFVTKDMNTAKGQMLDKDIPAMRGHIALRDCIMFVMTECFSDIGAIKIMNLKRQQDYRSDIN